MEDNIHTWMYMVKCDLNMTFSNAFRPLACAQSAGGRSCVSMSSETASIDCKSRMRKYETSWYANWIRRQPHTTEKKSPE